MNLSVIVFCVLISVVSDVISNPAIGDINKFDPVHSQALEKQRLEENFLKKLSSKCKEKDNSSCVMLKLVNYMNKILKKPAVTINDKFELLQTSVFGNTTSIFDATYVGRHMTASDDAILSMLVADKIWNFVRSRALKWKMSDLADLLISTSENGKINIGVSVDAKRAFQEGRGKMKNHGPLIAAVILKGLLIGALAFKALFLLSGKALLVSKLAFLLSSLIGVKKLLSKKKHTTTYEVVADHHRYDVPFAPMTKTQPAENLGGWARAMDVVMDSFVDRLSSQTDPHSMVYAHQIPIPLNHLS